MKFGTEIVKWQNIRNRIKAIHPELVRGIDSLAESKDLTFMVASYPFGADIIKNGRLQIYHDNILKDYQDSTLPPETLSLLHDEDNSLPVFMVLEKSAEIYTSLPSHVIPLRILKAGDLFSLTTFFNKNQTPPGFHTFYSCSSGSRSLVILPRVSHEQYNERLKKVFKLDDTNFLIPRNFHEQWLLFKSICQSSVFTEKNDWHSEVLIFSKEVLALIEKSVELKYFLTEELWKTKTFSLHHPVHDLIWSVFAEKHGLGFKSSPFVTETVRHLIKIVMGEVPAYLPVMNDDAAPVRALIDTYLNIYRIRYYLPLFVYSDYFDGKSSIYYSMQRHTFVHSIPERANANRTIDELLNVKFLINDFREQVLKNEFPFDLSESLLYRNMKDIRFDFFHPQAEPKDDIEVSIEKLLAENTHFTEYFNHIDYNKELTLPIHALFFNGCIRIQPIKKSEQKPSMKDFLLPLKDKRLDDDH